MSNGMRADITFSGDLAPAIIYLGHDGISVIFTDTSGLKDLAPREAVMARALMEHALKQGEES